MQLAKVVGTIVSTQKDQHLMGCKLMIIKKIDENGEYEKYSSNSTAIAVDTVGAGIGETVIVTQGSTARFVYGNKTTPMDMTIVGIVDEIQTSAPEVQKTL
ncbi:EutN/CcmL family microcompartment protein [Pseudoramibacter sp.]|jgi:ethanolamine utilization protein EutN|uniref:EutN/CcmL family microcompartment protein n=1 Tax=Pseudoramibacter sp. TaxID=2034862 RepID=UPI0025D26DA5|nr:EutN/CcmL family microcompartment protein [Pseudoramibacter sp.]MCH4072006.1 EutN/CcmL family microcompartment protein [Pseudoramibacter sp.]MCH4105775.1 EutN/CcmL family microcompartment protein [Pseudoramibacter sp.]